MDFDPISDHRCRLGESPYWWAERGELLYVDVHAGDVCSWSGGPVLKRHVAERVTFVMPSADGSLIVGLRHGIGTLPSLDAHDGDEIATDLAVEADRPNTSVNDARCDARGRLWFGTIDRVDRAPVCFLYTWSPERGLVAAVPGVMISNGIQWSPDGGTMYFVDSWAQRLDAFAYDGATGALGARRTVATIDPAEGMPDGINVDADGFVYVALFGGGCLHRYAPDGRLDMVIEVPVRHPTSCTFGGADRRTLYVTSGAVDHAATGPLQATATPHRTSALDGAVLAAEAPRPGQVERPCVSTRAEIAAAASRATKG